MDLNTWQLTTHNSPPLQTCNNPLQEFDHIQVMAAITKQSLTYL